MSAAAADPKGTTGTTDEDYDVLELCRAVVDAADAEDAKAKDEKLRLAYLQLNRDTIEEEERNEYWDLREKIQRREREKIQRNPVGGRNRSKQSKKRSKHRRSGSNKRKYRKSRTTRRR